MPLLSRHSLFAAGFRMLAAARTDRWLGPLTRGCGVILTFHHVRPAAFGAFAPNRLLEITPGFLDATVRTLRAEGFDIVPLDEVPSRLAAPGAKPFAALTFDDGYRDNVEHAAPVLRRHAAPWTLFVTTDFAEGRGRLWWLELERGDRAARTGRPHRRRGGARPAEPAAAEKRNAFAAIYWRLRAGPEDVLLATIARLAESAGGVPEGMVRSLCLGWDEIAELARDPAVAVGAHTVTHPMLAKHDEARARREIADGKAMVEAKLGRARAPSRLPGRRPDIGRPARIPAGPRGGLRDSGDDAARPPLPRPCPTPARPAAHLRQRPFPERSGVEEPCCPGCLFWPSTAAAG